jgi:hypothetical protein
VNNIASLFGHGIKVQQQSQDLRYRINVERAETHLSSGELSTMGQQCSLQTIVDSKKMNTSTDLSHASTGNKSKDKKNDSEESHEESETKLEDVKEKQGDQSSQGGKDGKKRSKDFDLMRLL